MMSCRHGASKSTIFWLAGVVTVFAMCAPTAAFAEDDENSIALKISYLTRNLPDAADATNAASKQEVRLLTEQVEAGVEKVNALEWHVFLGNEIIVLVSRREFGDEMNLSFNAEKPICQSHIPLGLWQFHHEIGENELNDPIISQSGVLFRKARYRIVLEYDKENPKTPRVSYPISSAKIVQ